MPLPIKKDLVASYVPQVFVETGTHHGAGVQWALDAGFDCIYSCEINPEDYGYCLRRFEDQTDKVHLKLDDSREFLREVMETLTTRALFWLDAHWCESGGGHLNDCPLLEELAIIGSHSIRTHIILIDDVRLFGSQIAFPTQQEVLTALREINSGYMFRYFNSTAAECDVLAAIPFIEVFLPPKTITARKS
jgi:hypothetical protein